MAGSIQIKGLYVHLFLDQKLIQVTFLDVSESVDGDTSSITSFTSYEWEKEIKKKMEDAKIYKPDWSQPSRPYNQNLIMQVWAIKWQIFNATHFKDIESVVAKRRADNTYRKVPITILEEVYMMKVSNAYLST